MMTENSLASPTQLGEHPLRDFVMDSEDYRTNDGREHDMQESLRFRFEEHSL